MGWPEAVVAIIIIVTIGRVMRSKYRAEHGILEDRRGNWCEPCKVLMPMLEKIATDDRGSRELQNEIEKLRDR